MLAHPIYLDHTAVCCLTLELVHKDFLEPVQVWLFRGRLRPLRPEVTRISHVSLLFYWESSSTRACCIQYSTPGRAYQVNSLIVYICVCALKSRGLAHCGENTHEASDDPLPNSTPFSPSRHLRLLADTEMLYSLGVSRHKRVYAPLRGYTCGRAPLYVVGFSRGIWEFRGAGYSSG